jgi:hypothetical protein
VINTIEANTRTEDLLKQSQSLAEELGRAGSRNCSTTNQELQEQGAVLAHQNQEVERKNPRSSRRRQALEEKGRAARADVQVQVRVPGQHVRTSLSTPLNSLRSLGGPACARTPRKT